MDNQHIVKSFDMDLSQVENLILEMGGLVEAQIENALTALLTFDHERAAKVREQDKAIDDLEHRIDELALNILALRQPMASDLRAVTCALKVASNLERIGDYAKNIAKRTQTFDQVSFSKETGKTLKRMGEAVGTMVSDILNTYLKKDAAMADEVILRDEEIDLMHNSLSRDILAHMAEDKDNIVSGMHLLFIAKNIERMGDHVTGIAEQVHYVITGNVPEDERPKADTTSQITG